MPRRQRLTNNSDETDIASLLSGDSVFSIPYFQRAYKWKPERLRQLERDMLALVDETNDFHFLGAVIIHGRRSNPSDPDVYEVIDGQQRITTIYLYLCAIVRTLSKHQEYAEAAGLFLKYIAIGRETSLVSNAKLQSCKDDRSQLNAVLTDVLSDSAFAEKLSPFKFKSLPALGTNTGRLRSNYRLACKFFAQQAEQEGIDRVRALYKALLESMSVVQIDVWDPTNGPKIFDALNSRQEPMTTGDLVRNEIFSRVANEHPEFIESLDQRVWQPFYQKFREGDSSLFDSYFFPYGLIKDPNLRKSDVYSRLREHWRSKTDPVEIIEDLSQFQNAFLDVVRGSNEQGHSPAMHAALGMLREFGAPSSVYPFVMQVSHAVANGKVTEANGLAVLGLVESFLVRRAVCGHEPTGLHAVFKRLWADCFSGPTLDSVAQAIRSHRTVTWPTPDDVRSAICSRPLYGSAVTVHLLRQWDKSLGGDQPNLDMWVEHVLPATMDATWLGAFTVEQHERQKDLLANLLPLSPSLNRSVGNRPYESKRHRYSEDSAYKAARHFAAEHGEWTPARLSERSAAMADWAVKRWPY